MLRYAIILTAVLVVCGAKSFEVEAARKGGLVGLRTFQNLIYKIRLFFNNKPTTCWTFFLLSKWFCFVDKGYYHYWIFLAVKAKIIFLVATFITIWVFVGKAFAFLYYAKNKGKCAQKQTACVSVGHAVNFMLICQISVTLLDFFFIVYIFQGSGTAINHNGHRYFTVTCSCQTICVTILQSLIFLSPLQILSLFFSINFDVFRRWHRYFYVTSVTVTLLPLPFPIDTATYIC